MGEGSFAEDDSEDDKRLQLCSFYLLKADVFEGLSVFLKPSEGTEFSFFFLVLELEDSILGLIQS